MDRKVLITGANGTLGQQLVQLLGKELPLILCARRQEDNTANGMEWRRFDLENPTTISMDGVKTIVHLASSIEKKSFKIDVEGTKDLLAQALRNKVEHFVFISIVGVDSFSTRYFRIKNQVEHEIQQSGIPYTILRSTQFFPFFEQEIIKYLRFPIAFLPSGILYQPIEISVVAKKLAKISLAEPVNGIVEIGGPEVLNLGEAARVFMEYKSLSKPIVNVPISLLGKLGRTLQSGVLTTNERNQDGLKWSEWLKK
ncbi:NAD(P)H-binding protein [Olivibacter sp. SDN3]|uniref:SDR family oxidoreductase n=1 Tax=Olivibacter sp. SDN3 TaxID=2764720 RepID=UPI0016514912|nr:NAD(P)H-binding protein [Olivibacter sp. SDN3]QNL48743.1 NAD(P)H-binding protein [Olivibacter sp. SDN3]